MATPGREDIGREHFRASIPERFWRPGSLLVAVAVAAWGQRMLERRDHPVDGVILLVLAAALFVLAARGQSGRDLLPELESPPPNGGRGLLIRSGRARALLLVATVGLAAVAFLEFADNRVATSPLTAWFLALGCFLLAFVEHPRRAGRGDAQARRRWPGVGVCLALIGVTLVAAFFLFFRLAAVPGEMTSDHAEKLLDVNDVLHGHWSIFFPRNTGREAMQFYFTGALIRWTPLPLGHLALKVGTAVVGLLAVPLTFLLGRQLFGTNVGLLAAALLAVSHWHLTLSRVGLRFPFNAAFAVVTLYFLFRALQGNQRNDWLACGLVLGAGLHGYMAFRMVPLLVILLIIFHALFEAASRLALSGRSRRRASDPGVATACALGLRYWGNALLSGFTCLLVGLPLIRYMLDEPRTFWFRTLTRVSSTERPLPPDLGVVFLDNVKNALLMFNYRGDIVWVNTVPFDPMLDWMTGALFVLGVAYGLWRVLAMRDRRSFYLFVSLFMLLLPSILSLAFPGENPSASRASGAVPLTMLVAALPLAVVGASLTRHWGMWGRWTGTLLGLAVVATAATLTYQWYFVKYATQYQAAAWNSRDMAAVIRAFVGRGGDMNRVYHVGYPHWVDTRAIAISAGDITWRNAITDMNVVRADADDGAAKLYLVHRDDAASLQRLHVLFPTGHASSYAASTPGKDFVVFEVPASGRR
jgi:Dolichyl-phosphate-mannose-protein mannosyltransferase